MVYLGCGGMIIENDSVLLIRRINSKTFNNLWSDPGGMVEKGESAEDACIREFAEELGIEVEIIKRLSTYDDYRGDVLIGKCVGFLVSIKSGTPSICEPEKIAEVKFWPLNDLPTDITPYTLQYLEDLKD